jgi:hypothetical protein
MTFMMSRVNNMKLILLKLRGLINLLIIFVQPNAKLKVVRATKIARKISVRLDKIIKNSYTYLSKTDDCKSNSYKHLKAITKAQSDLCSVINHYLGSKYPELVELKFIIYYINVNDTCIRTMEEVELYLHFKMQIQLLQVLVEIINNKEPTDYNKRLLEAAKKFFEESKEMHVGIGSSTLSSSLIAIKAFIADIKKGIKKLPP